ncbi:MAG: 50S ribosomal protein L29 [Saprospiraceae bacterium]|nr:50S ribosomal protein L29 [Saprospiraceae bacterium]
MGLKKYNEFSKMQDAALQEELKSAKARINSMKFEHKVKGLSNPTTITHLRREIAQMSTELTKRKNTAN